MTHPKVDLTLKNNLDQILQLSIDFMLKNTSYLIIAPMVDFTLKNNNDLKIMIQSQLSR